MGVLNHTRWLLKRESVMINLFLNPNNFSFENYIQLIRVRNTPRNNLLPIFSGRGSSDGCPGKHILDTNSTVSEDFLHV